MDIGTAFEMGMARMFEKDKIDLIDTLVEDAEESLEKGTGEGYPFDRLVEFYDKVSVAEVYLQSSSKVVPEERSWMDERCREGLREIARRRIKETLDENEDLLVEYENEVSDSPFYNPNFTRDRHLDLKNSVESEYIFPAYTIGDETHDEKWWKELDSPMMAGAEPRPEEDEDEDEDYKLFYFEDED